MIEKNKPGFLPPTEIPVEVLYSTIESEGIQLFAQTWVCT